MDMQPIIDGLQVAAIGFTVVMIALILLWAIMVAFSRFLGPEEYRNKLSADRSRVRGAAPGAGGQTDAAGSHAAGADTAARAEHMRRVAAITAAITATMAASGGADFRIVSVRPVRDAKNSSWKFAGRRARLQQRPRART